jgi:hypothetical protein
LCCTFWFLQNTNHGRKKKTLQRYKSVLIEKIARKAGKIGDIAMARASNKNQKGNKVHTANSFSVLEDDDNVNIALEIGDQINKRSFEKVALVRDLEKAR